MIDSSVAPRIYVACLASYNAGTLHGEWIDADQDADAIHKEIQEMLSRSREFIAEEWAIHDYEGFGGYELSEWESIADVARIAENIEEHGEVFGALLSHTGDLDHAEEVMNDGYMGEWNSLADYAESSTRDCHEIPDFLDYYIDWQAMSRDMEQSGDITTIKQSGRAHVFLNL